MRDLGVCFFIRLKKKLIAEIKTKTQSRLMTGKGLDNSNIFDL